MPVFEGITGVVFFSYLVFINIFAFLLCAVDKFKAVTDRYRISERALFTSAILGGTVGLYLSMFLFRHKTRHTSFTLGVPFIALVQFCLWKLLFK